MKSISRRDFLKGALAGTAAAALSTVTGIPAARASARHPASSSSVSGVTSQSAGPPNRSVVWFRIGACLIV